MYARVSEYSTFFREFRRTFQTTGAMVPSGRRLARALVRPLRRSERPARILEVGPGTGAVTREIVRWIKPQDRLDMVELNDQFVQVLRRRFSTEPAFQKVVGQVEIFHMPVQELPPGEPYDFIISGLPMNNFSPELVKQILRRLMELLRPGGTLSFFEYLAIRRMKMVVASKQERRRVASVGRVVQHYLRRYERQRDVVWWNVLPAVAHHLRNGASR